MTKEEATKTLETMIAKAVAQALADQPSNTKNAKVVEATTPKVRFPAYVEIRVYDTKESKPRVFVPELIPTAKDGHLRVQTQESDTFESYGALYLKPMKS